ERSRFGRRVDEEFRKHQRNRVRQSSLFKNLGELAAAAKVEDDESSLRQRFDAMVEQSGVRTTPARLLTLAACLGLSLGGVAGFSRQSVVLGAIAALVGFAVPFVYVLMKYKARQRRLLAQLPDAFDLMSRVIRAGQTMSQ